MNSQAGTDESREHRRSGPVRCFLKKAGSYLFAAAIGAGFCWAARSAGADIRAALGIWFFPGLGMYLPPLKAVLCFSGLLFASGVISSQVASLLGRRSDRDAVFVGLLACAGIVMPLAAPLVETSFLDALFLFVFGLILGCIPTVTGALTWWFFWQVLRSRRNKRSTASPGVEDAKPEAVEPALPVAQSRSEDPPEDSGEWPVAYVSLEDSASAVPVTRRAAVTRIHKFVGSALGAGASWLVLTAVIAFACSIAGFDRAYYRPDLLLPGWVTFTLMIVLPMIGGAVAVFWVSRFQRLNSEGALKLALRTECVAFLPPVAALVISGGAYGALFGGLLLLLIVPLTITQTMLGAVLMQRFTTRKKATRTMARAE